MLTWCDRAGKTPPRFIQDLVCYDPALTPRSNFNLLTGILPLFTNEDSYPEIVSPNHCTHYYVTKSNQTRVPSENSKHGPGKAYRVSSVCAKCRCHLELTITYKDSVPETGHIHHLVPTPGEFENPFRSKGQQQEAYQFYCSDSQCSAHVTLKLRSPLFKPEWINLLTDEKLLAERMEEALKVSPDRLEGVSRPLPVTVLSSLKTYIDIALQDEQRSRTIAPGNKRFTTCFGVKGKPCKSLLEFIGFTSKVRIVCLLLFQWTSNK